uniref:hypothetical protein n=1 Tax=Phenylobacterium sp. TaxID=1871053 RepID=UPI00286C5A56
DPEIQDDDGESFHLLGLIQERLDDVSEEEDFLDLDPDQLIARLCEELSVEAARADAVLAPHKAVASAAPPETGPTPGARPNGHDAPPPPANTS